jgi:hypothetical protein
MNVPTIGQGPGSVTLPDPRAGGSPPVGRGSGSDAEVGRLAWFDVNGDGQIDARSPLAGGDATLIVPAHVAHLTTYSREVRRTEEPDEQREVVRDTAPEAAASDVTTRHAIDAYARYGQPAAIAPTDRVVA